MTVTLPPAFTRLVLFTFFLFLATSACARNEEAPPASTRAPAAQPERKASEDAVESGSDTHSPERRVIRRAELQLSSSSVVQSADEAVRHVTEAGGYVGQREQRNRGERVVEANLVLRVPAVSFEEVLQTLKRGTEVVRERVTGEDVTHEFQDTEARLRAQAVLEERLLGLLEETGEVKDLLEVERELARVRTEIERLSGRRKWLSNQTALATIELAIQSPEQPLATATESVASRFKNAFAGAVELSVVVMTSLIKVAGVFFPFIPVPILFYVGYRLQRRRRTLASNP